MKRIKFITIFLALYWLLATNVLFDFINGNDNNFPIWFEMFLFPGYLLGLALGYGGGNTAAIIGQLITLAIIVMILYLLAKSKAPIKKK